VVVGDYPGEHFFRAEEEGMNVFGMTVAFIVLLLSHSITNKRIISVIHAEMMLMQTEVNIDTMEPYDTLTPVALDWCRENGSQATTVSEIIDSGDNKVHARVNLSNGLVVFPYGNVLLCRFGP